MSRGSDPSDETRRYERSPADLPPQVGGRIDDFLLVDRLGEGAFATVYLAHQVSMHRTVALKVTATQDREAQTLARLDHPSIVRVFDQRPAPARHVHLIYMEYVPGGTLEAVVERVRGVPAEPRGGRSLLETVDAALARRGEEAPADSMLRSRLARATWPETVCLAGVQLAEALDYAHRRGVLHHDVKPGNVLLAANGRVKLADFNVSSAAALEGVDEEETLGGSLPYMSPEQLDACRLSRTPDEAGLDGRSDLFALGVLLWELLGGRRPFADERVGFEEDDGLERLAESRRRGVPSEALRVLPADTPPLLESTLLACLEPDPDRRPASGAELARRLGCCLDREARALLTPPKTGWRAWAGRFPLLALFVAGLLPNLVLSVLNISYNLQVAVGGRWDEFQQQVAVVNAVVYTVGIGLGLYWTLGVTRTRDRMRVLRLGDRLAWLLVALWSLTGVVFAVWQHAQSGEASLYVYYQFVLSLALFGVLAATLCFFLVNRIVVGVLLPARIGAGDVDLECAERGRGLARRTYAFYGACTAVPFVSVVALALQTGDHRAAFLVLGLLGGLGFALTSWLGAGIRRDLDTLARVLDPGRVGPAGS